MVLAADTREALIDKSTGRKVGVTVHNNVPGAMGVVVTALEARNTLAITKLQVGDTILSVDGELVNDHASAIRRIDASRGTLRLVVGPASDVSAVLSSSSKASHSQDDCQPEPRFVVHQPLYDVGNRQ